MKWNKVLIHKTKIITALLFVICFASIRSTWSQEAYRDEWEELVEGVDYEERYKEIKREPKEIKERKQRSLPSMSLGFMKPLIMVLVVAGLALLIFWVLKNFFNFFEEKVKDENIVRSVESLEDNLNTADFEGLLKRALDKGEYRLAIRIYYLKSIKLLDDLGMIKWKRDKTNGSYVREMLAYESGQNFSFLTRLYEEAWFGNHAIDHQMYQSAAPIFSSFISNLKALEKK